MEETRSSSVYARLVENLVERIIEIDVAQRDFDADFKEYNYYISLLKRLEQIMETPDLPISRMFLKRRKPIGSIGEEKIKEPQRKKRKTETDEDTQEILDK